MKTKIVYVVASQGDDIYMEQAIVSAWSAHYYNPDCCIEMVCDQDTYNTCKSGIRKKYVSLFDKIHVRDFLPEQSMMERSRWMKTTLRDIIEGDILYLDTDTVVCTDLSYVDYFSFDLGMVQDCHCEFDKSLFKEWIVPTMKKIYNLEVAKESQYFNSGVFFVRDNQKTRDFFHHWNELWIYSAHDFNIMKDQQPLMKANIDMGYFITEMSGDLNCQVATSIQHLHTAHVMHFFNCLLGKSPELTPFNKDVYLSVKQYGLTAQIKETILNCKSSFTSPSMPITYDSAVLLRHTWKTCKLEKKIKSSNSYHIISYVWWHYPKLMQLIDNFLGMLIRVLRRVK